METVDQRMRSVTLPTCSVMRQTCNEILSDALFYFTSFHGQNVINIVTKGLNKAYSDFMTEYPDFKGKIAFMGHSVNF